MGDKAQGWGSKVCGHHEVKLKKTKKNMTFDNLKSLQKVIEKNLLERPYNHFDADFDKYTDDE